MKLDHLLQQRLTLVRQTRLANVAFVFAELGALAERITRAGLRGQVTLYLADPANERLWPSLVADEGSQSVIEEHFLETDIIEFADLLAFAAGDPMPAAFTFRLEDLDRQFRTALGRELAAAGVDLPGTGPRIASTGCGNTDHDAANAGL